MKLKHLIGGVVIVITASGAFAANRPAGFVTICNEGKTCSVVGTRNVAFGRADYFFYRPITGTVICSESTFGGRVAGGVNECSIAINYNSSSSSNTSYDDCRYYPDNPMCTKSSSSRSAAAVTTSSASSGSGHASSVAP